MGFNEKEIKSKNRTKPNDKKTGSAFPIRCILSSTDQPVEEELSRFSFLSGGETDRFRIGVIGLSLNSSYERRKRNHRLLGHKFLQKSFGASVFINLLKNFFPSIIPQICCKFILNF